MGSLQGKVIFITGSTRGIGREIALKCAEDGAKIVITGKTVDPHPRLPGTLASVADEVKEAGGEALAIALDVRDDKAVKEAMDKTADHWGGVDILVNNASAIGLTSTEDTPMKRFDLMHSVNARATFACSQAALPHLRRAQNPHILSLSPPFNMAPSCFEHHVAYTISKYGMSMCTLGMAEEFKQEGIAVNSLWPKTTIATMAIKVNFPPEIWQASRKSTIVADAAYAILTQDSREATGRFFIDEDVLREKGVEDFSDYAIDPNVKLFSDLFL